MILPINSISIIPTLNAIKNIKSLINITGIVIIQLIKILDNSIVSTDVGKLFVMLKLFPSRDIEDDVIDVIQAVYVTRQKNIFGISEIIVFISIPSPSVIVFITPFMFTLIAIVTINNKIKPNDVLKMYTVEEKYLFNSFDTNADNLLFTFTLLSMFFSFLFFPFSDDLDIIPK